MVLLQSLQRSWGGYDLIFGARNEDGKSDQFSFSRSIVGDLRMSVGNPSLATRFIVGKSYNVDISPDDSEEEKTQG
jgi:hypothetical protein